jgi:hypothetical protein
LKTFQKFLWPCCLGPFFCNKMTNFSHKNNHLCERVWVFISVTQMIR